MRFARLGAQSRERPEPAELRAVRVRRARAAANMPAISAQAGQRIIF